MNRSTRYGAKPSSRSLRHGSVVMEKSVPSRKYSFWPCQSTFQKFTPANEEAPGSGCDMPATGRSRGGLAISAAVAVPATGPLGIEKADTRIAPKAIPEIHLTLVRTAMSLSAGRTRMLPHLFGHDPASRFLSKACWPGGSRHVPGEGQYPQTASSALPHPDRPVVRVALEVRGECFNCRAIGSTLV